MSFFPFIESIFYLSLGVIVVLIFLIVFHFKQRIESLEKKSFVFTEMYNSLIKEMNIIKTVVYSPPVVQQKQNIIFSTEESIKPNTNYNKIIVMDKLVEEEAEDLESESESESESDSESESECDLDVEELNDMEVIELEPELEKNDLEEESIHVLKVEPDLEPEPEPESTNTNTSTSLSYQNLNLNELKKLVITKGLTTNSNKLKRAEILKLLEEETI